MLPIIWQGGHVENLQHLKPYNLEGMLSSEKVANMAEVWADSRVVSGVEFKSIMPYLKMQGAACWSRYKAWHRQTMVLCRTSEAQFVKYEDLDLDICEKTIPEYSNTLGPQCPLLARKFAPETADAITRLISECKNRLKIVHSNECHQLMMLRKYMWPVAFAYEWNLYYNLEFLTDDHLEG